MQIRTDIDRVVCRIAITQPELPEAIAVVPNDEELWVLASEPSLALLQAEGTLVVKHATAIVPHLQQKWQILFTQRLEREPAWHSTYQPERMTLTTLSASPAVMCVCSGRTR